MVMIKPYDYQQKLIDETRRKLAEGSQGVLIVSPAGSGKSIVISEIARLTTLRGGIVLFIVHRQELVNQITESFKKQDVDLTKCTILTVGKVPGRFNKIPKPSLIITDESHHSRANTYQKIYEYYSDVPRLGFTATPWRMNGKGFKDIYPAMVEGPTVKWLIEHKKLAPYDYFSVNLADAGKLHFSGSGDFSNKSIEDALGKTIFGDVIKTWKKIANGRKTILYAHSRKYSAQIAQKFCDAGIKAVHCDSKTPAKERETIMSDFKAGKIKILCNVDLISEGFNVPDCSCVVMLRPTASLVLDVQQSMRCMRYMPDKRAVIIDHVGNCYRHGVPITPRKWTLEDRKRKKRRKATDVNYPIKTCPSCFSVVPAQCRVCPVCGAEIPIEKSGMKEERDAKIVKLNQFKFVTDYKKTRYAQMNPNEAKTVEDLYAIAKARGYKPGWAYVQAKKRGMLR